MVHAPPAAVRKNRQRKAPEHASTRERDLGVGVGERDSATVAMDRSMCVPAHLSPPRPRAAVAGAAPSPLLSPPIFAAAGGGAGAHPPDGHTTSTLPTKVYTTRVWLYQLPLPRYTARENLLVSRSSCAGLVCYIIHTTACCNFTISTKPTTTSFIFTDHCHTDHRLMRAEKYTRHHYRYYILALVPAEGTNHFPRSCSWSRRRRLPGRCLPT